MDDNEEFEKKKVARDLNRIAQSSSRVADAFKGFDSAIQVFLCEIRETMDAHPNNANRETRAKEIGEAAVARAIAKNS